MKDEALKLALEALESERDKYLEWGDEDGAPDDVYEAITAIKQALALDKKAENARELGLDYEPAPVQEPFCFVYVENGEEYFAPKGAYVPDNAQPLYTTQPAAQRQWVGLTDEEREEIALEVPMDAVCITEAKLKEKNT
jgi:hypothetical protein